MFLIIVDALQSQVQRAPAGGAEHTGNRRVSAKNWQLSAPRGPFGGLEAKTTHSSFVPSLS